jgi:Flp pilus assembly pilin Flp
MSANRRERSFWADEAGASMAEFGLVAGTLVLVLMGVLDFGTAFWQYNQATKALQLGARLAAVSDPVSSDLKTYDGTSSTVFPGDAMPYFERRCSGAKSTCTNGTFDAAALNAIVYGRGATSCPATPQRLPGMCSAFPRLRPRNVAIDYIQTGLGFAGRPGGSAPTITVRLTGMTYDFIVLNRMLRLPPLSMSGLSVTTTAEDMSGG